MFYLNKQWVNFLMVYYFINLTQWREYCTRSGLLKCYWVLHTLIQQQPRQLQMTLCVVSRLWYQNSNHTSPSMSRGPSPVSIVCEEPRFLLRWWSHGKGEKECSEQCSHVLSHSTGDNPETTDRHRETIKLCRQWSKYRDNEGSTD